MKPVVAFLVNGGSESAMAIRARSFAERLCDDFDITIEYRGPSKSASILRFIRTLQRIRPSICYVFDAAYSGVIAGLVYCKLSRCRLIIDTGDAIYELAKTMGRGRLGLALTSALEHAALQWSDGVVVRSHFHQEWLRERRIEATVVPDGVDTQQFQFAEQPDLRRQYGLENVVTIGILGSLTWNERTGHCYGLEILEVIRKLKDHPVKGVIIGDGSGRKELERRVHLYGIADRIVFLGRVPYNALPRYLSCIDICVSTQTNDLPGRVRTTGKLPLYLAAGRFVLATNVGEAARVLPPEMLVPYHGDSDPKYPERLAEAVLVRLDSTDRINSGAAVAKKHFDYDLLAVRLQKRLDTVLLNPEAASQRLVGPVK